MPADTATTNEINLYEDFRCVLAAHYIVQKARTARRAVSSGALSRQHKKPLKPPHWQRILNSLCVLCDFEKGGSTTTSVAVEQGRDDTAIWVTVNDRKETKTEKARQHLEFIVTKLISPGQSNNDSTCLQQVIRRTINLCEKRMNQYLKLLYSAINHLSVRSESLSPAQNDLLEQISTLCHKSLGKQAICKSAYEFRNTILRRLLEQGILKGSTREWKTIFQNLVRLGRWHRAVHYLLEQRSTMRTLFGQGVKVKSVPTPKDGNASQKPSMLTLEQIFDGRLSGSSGIDTSLERIYKLFGKDRINAIYFKFFVGGKPGTKKTKLHAEAVVLDHFHKNRLEFLKGQRQIGCSKRSCLSCYHYFDIHPSKPSARLCHHNAWPMWRVPDLLCEKPDLMKAMVDKLRKDFLRSCVSDHTLLNDHHFTQDTTTYFSSQLASLSLGDDVSAAH